MTDHAPLNREYLVPPSTTHLVTGYRLEAHQKAHPDHDQREMTGVADKWATWGCSCGVVFRTGEVDESVLSAYKQALEAATRAEIEAHRQRQIAADRRMEARMIIANLQEGM